MRNLGIYLFISLLIAIIIQLINICMALKEANYAKMKNNQIKFNYYKTKSLMTRYEKYFYDILVELEDELNVRIHPQVNLATIIHKETNNRYITELFRNIDFGIFSKDYGELILLIEINDNTHNSKNRIIRDRKVDEILDIANIRLIKFYSNYPNKREYIKKRVKDEIISVRISKNKI